MSTASSAPGHTGLSRTVGSESSSSCSSRGRPAATARCTACRPLRSRARTSAPRHSSSCVTSAYPSATASCRAVVRERRHVASTEAPLSNRLKPQRSFIILIIRHKTHLIIRNIRICLIYNYILYNSYLHSHLPLIYPYSSFTPTPSHYSAGLATTSLLSLQTFPAIFFASHHHINIVFHSLSYLHITIFCLFIGINPLSAKSRSETSI